jgi:glycosyltransferase involved in cell wall biosynthesis
MSQNRHLTVIVLMLLPATMMRVKNEQDIILELFSAVPASLRVALVTETFPPEINGVAMTLGNIVKGLLHLGHTVQIVRPRQAREVGEAEPRTGVDEVLAKGIPIPNYPDLRFGVLSENRLMKLWRQKRPDVVHVATEGPLGWSAVTAARKLQLPVTSSFHTNFHQYSGNYGIGLLKTPIDAYLRKLHNRTMVTMAPTQVMARTLQGRGYRNVSVLSRGVTIEQFTPVLRSAGLRAAWGIGDTDVAVLYVGRLAKEKNVGVVLTAFSAIQQHLPSAKMVFVGDGPLRGTLQEACPRAIFAGMKTGKELATCYASSDMFLFPSLTETFGNVVPEALASGLAVVSYDCAAAANLITNGRNGVLVAPGEEIQFVNSAVALAIDREQRNAVRQHAAPSVAHMSWSVVHETFVNTLRTVIERHEAQPRWVLPRGAQQAAALGAD